MAWNSDAYLAGSYDAPAPAGKRTTDLDVDAILQEEGAAHLKPIVQAIYGQESSSGSNPRTSIDGARGGMQVIPATFRRFAREGEAIDNPADNMRAGVRYIKFLGDQFGNDPARIAAGYFSGEGNVAKTGDSPFIHDRADGNGTRVSQYVPGVLKRMAGAVIPSAQAAEKKKEPAAQDNILSWDQVAASPEYQAMDGDQKDVARRQYFADVVAPKVPTPDIDSAWAQFDQDSRPAGVGKRVAEAGKQAIYSLKRQINLANPGLLDEPPAMDGFQAPGQEAGSRKVLGMSESGYNKTRNQMLAMDTPRLQRVSEQGGVMGQVADQVLQERGAYAGKTERGQATTLDDLQMGGEIKPPADRQELAALVRELRQPTNAERPDGFGEKVSNAGMRGLHNAGAMASGLAALGADAVGADQLATSLLKENLKASIAAQKYPAAIQDFTHINSMGDVPTYVLEGVVENAPQLIGSIGAGVIGKKLATAFGQKAVAGMVAEQAAKELARRGVVGAAAGAGVASIGMESGSIYGDIFQETGERRPGTAAGFGAVAGALDAIPAVRAATKLIGQAPVEEGLKAIAKKYGKDVALQMLEEGGTEFLQTWTEKAAVSSVDGRPLFTADNMIEAFDAMFKGAAAGGGTTVAIHGAQDAARAGQALRDRLDPNGAALRELNGLVEGGQFDAAATDRAARTSLSTRINGQSVIPEESRGFLPDRGGDGIPDTEQATPAKAPGKDPVAEAPEMDSITEAIPPATNPIADELLRLEQDAGIASQATPIAGAPAEMKGVQNEEDSQAPQGPAQDGANPVAPEGGAGSDAGGLSIGGSAQRDVPGQEVNEADQVARRATGIAEARVVPVESLSSAREGGGKGPGISREAGSLASTIAWMSGKQAVFYTGGPTGPDALVNLAHPQQIFINADSNEATALHATAGHEIGHLIKREAPEAFGPFMQVVKSVSNIDMDSDAGLLAYVPEYWRESAPLIDKMRQAGATDAAIVDALLKEHGNGYTREQLREEFYQDVFGNRFREKGFWQNVIREMARTDMSLLQKFRQVLDQIIQAVSNHHSQGFAADKFISDLKAVRDAAARTYVGYAGRDGMRQKIAKMTPAELLVTKKAHPDGIVKDLAAAELKRRETDAAYAQREAQKDAERGTIAADTLAIRGKALEQQEAATRAGGFDEAGQGAMAQALSGAKQGKRAERGRAVAEVRKAKEKARAATKAKAAQLEDNEQGLYAPQRQGATRENATQETRVGQDQAAPVGAQAVRTDARGDGATRRADRGDAQQRGPGAAGDTLQGGNGHAGLPPRTRKDYGHDSNRQERAAPTGQSPLEERDDPLRAEASDAARRALEARGKPGKQDQQVLKSPQRQAAALWNALSQHEDIYQFPRSEADSLAGVLSEVAPQFKVSERHLFSEKETRQGLAKKFVVKTADGKEATVYQNKQGELWVNASALKEGQSGGSRLYAGLLNYAYNNGLKFIGDPLGVSDAAIFRRTENMLASALKFGTTEHMAPAKEQQTPGLYAGAVGHRDGVVDKFASMKWKEGDDLANLESLLHVSYTNITRFVPEIKNVYYDFKSGEFRWSGDARAVTDREWGDLGDALATRLLGAGLDSLPGALGGTGHARRQGSTLPAPQPGVDPRSVSLKRVALSHTLLREPSEEGRRAVLGEVSRLVQGASLGGLKGVLYSPQRLVVPDAIIANTLGEASKDADHDLAKAGDLAAGARLATKLVSPDLVAQLAGIEKPIVLGVVSIEATGRNKLPFAAAKLISDSLKAELDTDTVQSSRPKRTQMAGLDRVFNRPEFDGPVQPGRNYILVDDTLTQGGTFAALAGHITQGGGNVAAVVALTGKQYSRIIQPTEQTLSALREKFGDLEDAFQQATGYRFDGLTESEARYLTNFKPAESVRDRILAAGNEAGREEAGPAAGPETLASPLRRARELRDKVQTRLDDAVDGLSGLPDIEQYLTNRNLTMGRIARVDEIAHEIRKVLGKATDADQTRIYEYLTTKGAASSTIADPAQRKMAERVKTLINYAGDQLVGRGMLDQASRDAHKDQYLPRLYLKHLMSDSVWKMVGAGKKASDLGYLKGRKDIPKDVRDVILGEVTDPEFLSVVAVSRSMRDMAILDWIESMAQNTGWVFPATMVDYNGRRVSAYWLKSEADRIEKQAAFYTPANKVKAGALVAKLREKANQALDGEEVDHKKFRQIPDTARYGMIRGMYVRREIYNDIMGMGGAVDPDPSLFSQVFGLGHIGTRATQAFKTVKVVMNPPSQVRNFVSNTLMLHLSGVDFHMLPIRLAQAVDQILNDGPYWKVAKKYGVTGGTFSANELYRAKAVFLSLQKDRHNPLAYVMQAARALPNAVADVYQFAEALGKVAKIIDEMKKGKSEAAAVIEANKWLFDYSLVPKAVREARNSPIGAPFITYQVKLLPRLLEVATTKPWRLLPYIAFQYGMFQLAAASFGTGMDELDKLRKALPEWLRDNPYSVPLPWMDDEGRVQFFNVSYFLPYSWYGQIANHIVKGEPVKALQDLASQFSSPVLGAVVAMVGNYDSFTRKPIANPGDPAKYQVLAYLNYIWDLITPPIFSSHGVASPMGFFDKQYGGKAVQALTGATNKFGDTRATPAQAAWAAVGMNYYSVDPEHSRMQNMQQAMARVEETERLLQLRLYDRSLTDAQRKQYVEDYRDHMRELAEEARKYGEESEVPEQLKVKK